MIINEAFKPDINNHSNGPSASPDWVVASTKGLDRCNKLRATCLRRAASCRSQQLWGLHVNSSYALKFRYICTYIYIYISICTIDVLLTNISIGIQLAKSLKVDLKVQTSGSSFCISESWIGQKSSQCSALLLLLLIITLSHAACRAVSRGHHVGPCLSLSEFSLSKYIYCKKITLFEKASI